jgi:anti-anti-sigma factor
MGDQYLMTWVDRSDRVTVLRVRGELDAVTADGFAIEAVRLLRHVDGPVAVDLSLLGFIDCAGARTLAAVLDTMLHDRLVGVRGIRRPVSRLIDVIGLDLKRLVQELRWPRTGPGLSAGDPLAGAHGPVEITGPDAGVRRYHGPARDQVCRDCR